LETQVIIAIVMAVLAFMTGAYSLGRQTGTQQGFNKSTSDFKEWVELSLKSIKEQADLGLRSEVLRNDSITNRIDKAAQETSERQASLAKEYADKFQSLAVQVEHCKTVCDECKGRWGCSDEKES